MSVVLKKTSTITEKGQTTVPKSVREALGLDYGGRIAFYIDENQRVSVERDDAEDDPVIGSFLTFLADDMARNPKTAIVDIPVSLQARIHSLVKEMPVDLDAAIDGEVDL